MQREVFNAFWEKLVDSVQNNRGRIETIEFDGNKLEFIHHYVSNYECSTINSISIIFTPKDIVWCEDRRIWERNAYSYPYKITNSQLNALKNSVEKYLAKKGVLQD